MKITALIENTSARGLPTEHGLSLFVETAEHKFLFDMGQTDLFARNAETLGIALSKVDFAVLSHGHYDHGGGLNTFLALNDHAPVYMSRYAFEPHYNGTEKNIGLDQGLKSSNRLVLVDEDMPIAEGIIVYGCHHAPKVVDFGSCGLNMIQDGRMTERIGNVIPGYAKALDAYPTAYYTGHCTGTAQYQFMKERMRNLHYLSVGDSIVI